MKKLLSFLFFCGVALSAVAYSFEVDGIYYSDTSSSTCEVCNNGNYNSYSGDVSIPASVTYGANTYSVTSIGLFAFKGCSSLTSVTIPSSVTSIEDSAFGDCSSLTSVTIPEGVTSIGIGAFLGCNSLTSVSIPETVTKVGSNVFNNTLWYNSQEDGLLYLDDWLLGFKGSEPEGVLIIKDGTKGIAQSAFYGCSSLTSVTISDGVTNIGSDAFYGCSSLTSVTIPEGVTNIFDYTFRGCSSLTSVTIPESVTSIGRGAFRRCSSLTSVTIPEGVTSIGGYAFEGCSSLTSVTIPEGVTNIFDYTFRGCSSLTSVTIPSNVTDIGGLAFSGCSSLTSVTIPEGVTRIENYAFSGCSNLSSITIPNSVTSIGEHPFDGTAWYNSQEDGLLYLDNWLLGYKGSKPEGTLIIKDGTKGMANDAFFGCTGLTGITIPESVTYIASNAFSDWSSLTSVTIPAGVTSIGEYAFFGCSSLTSVTMKSDVPCSIYSLWASSENFNINIFVPYGCGDVYKSAEGWSRYAKYIVEMPSEDYLYMEDIKTFHKSQLTVPVLMKNAKPFTAFQCDITLPEGLTLHKTMNEDDEEVFDIAYGSRAKSTHSLMANQLANGNIRVAGYSSSNADYRDSEDMFFTLTVDVADDASGDLPIKLSNVILTSATDGDTECPDTEAVLTIIPGQPGDVNGDGKLTMGDVVKLVNHILEVSQTGFNADLADVNEDGKVTMGDVVIVLNMILSGDYPIKAPSMRQTMAKDEVEDDAVL